MIKQKNDYLNIVYEDENIIVVNKRTKLLTIRDPKKPLEDNLYSQVSYYLKTKNKNSKVFIVHRLDKDTSGLVIFSKNYKYKEILQKEFESQNVVRLYECKVDNKFIYPTPCILKNYLFFDNFNNVFVSKKKTNIEAITEVLCSKYDKQTNKSLLEIKIHTGKRNQIRCQLSNIDNPIVGDKKYNGSKNNRLLLNSYKLEFPNLKNILKVNSFTIDKIFK